ncbi:MAG: SusC/RagA family TonB-linked outer membrane protein [Gemmatimonadota bacterium]
MKRIIKFVALFGAAAVLPLSAAAQDSGTVTGVVVEANTQRPLASVQVQVAGTNRGTLTNALGRYIIANVPPGQRTVRASLIGFSQGEQTVNVAAGASETVNFELRTSAIELAGVVVSAVTGRAERRREIGTNVASITAEDLELAPITNVADALTARTEGVDVMSSSGVTGSSQRIRIRGANSLSLSNEPLIYVDGIQFNNELFDVSWPLVGGQGSGSATSRLNDINPADIESVEILKGPAATSQYGTAAANGVILITTRRGTAEATRWNAYSEYGIITEPNEYPANYIAYEVLEPGAPLFNPNGSVNIAADGTAARLPCYNFQAATGACQQDSVAVFNTLEDPRTTPFEDGFRRKFGASVSGGSGQTTYYISGDIEDEQGVISYNTLSRASVRANLDAALTDQLRVQVNTAYIDSDLAVSEVGNSVFAPLINGYVGRAFFNPDTTTGVWDQNYRAFSQQSLSEFVPMEGINRLTLGGSANYQPLSWLSIGANSGLDFTNRLWQLTVQPDRYLRIVAPSYYGVGARETQRANRFLWSSNVSGNAVFSLSDRVSSSTTVGASYQRDNYRGLYNEGAGIVEGTEDVGGAAGQFTLDEHFTETRTVGAFVSQQFGLDDRLFVTLGIRGDDTSAFGADFGFVTYPNANLSWVLDEEAWFPETDLVTSLRVRAGYGTSGLRPQFRDAITLFEPIAVQREGADEPAVILDVTGNPGLEPERTTEYELGFDAGFFGDRLGANLTYYNRTSKDALIDVPLAPSFGLTANRIDNLGSVRNSGVELGLDAQILDSQPARLNLRLSTTTLDNEIVTIGGVDDIVINRGEQRHREGFPAGGFFQDRYVIDDDGDGLLAPGELTIVQDTINQGTDEEEVLPNYIGPAMPTLTNSLSADLTLFDIVTVSTLFDHRGGHHQLSLSEEFRCRTAVGLGDRGCARTADPNATLEEQAAFIAGSFYGTRIGYIYPADFIKWRELSVSLRAPASLAATSRILEGATLMLSGRNLATWTDYPGPDPEGAEGGLSNFNLSDFNVQPPVRYWTARLNFTF